MTVELVTGFAGEPHVSSDDIGNFQAGVYAQGTYVLSLGQNPLQCTLKDANTVTVNTGSLIFNGRFVRIVSETVTLEAGTQGQKRNDLIVIRYTKDASTGVETAALAVVKGANTTGTPADPAIATATILSGATTSEAVIARVTIDGLTPATPVMVVQTMRAAKTVDNESAKNKTDIAYLQTSVKTNITNIAANKTAAAKAQSTATAAQSTANTANSSIASVKNLTTTAQSTANAAKTAAATAQSGVNTNKAALNGTGTLTAVSPFQVASDVKTLYATKIGRMCFLNGRLVNNGGDIKLTTWGAGVKIATCSLHPKQTAGFTAQGNVANDVSFIDVHTDGSIWYRVHTAHTWANGRYVDLDGIFFVCA
ncbi:MAG: hypothetical protein LKJ47_04770 [Bifidobacteriaceae bacterium]|jgi:hypothetical protein|nr:hypothetical protein [Bifidobacteriaceae bacterium]